MIKLIAGPKGTGKTAKLVDDINAVAATGSRFHLRYLLQRLRLNTYLC